MMKRHQVSIPLGLMTALEKRRLTFVTPTTIYHTIWNPGYGLLIGVIGDGENGVYEWFIWDDGSKYLRTSDVGFGSDFAALCCGLVESRATRANGDHDLSLTWKRDQERA